MKHTIDSVPTLETEPTKPPTKATWHKVGNSALAHYGEVVPEPTPIVEAQENFEHLFPATRIPAELLLTEAATAEGAERLLERLTDGDPYKDYAIGELALYHMNQNDIPRAYELFRTIKDPGIQTHILSQIFLYQIDHHIEAIPLTELAPQLHDLAIHTYDQEPTAANAKALVEASEALEDDDELRLFSRIALREHPEIRQTAEPLTLL